MAPHRFLHGGIGIEFWSPLPSKQNIDYNLMRQLFLIVLLALELLPSCALAQTLIYRPVVGLAQFQGDSELAARLSEQLVSRLESSPWLQVKKLALAGNPVNARPNTITLRKNMPHYLVTARIDKREDGSLTVLTYVWQMALGPATGRTLTAPPDALGDVAQTMARFLEQVAGDPKNPSGPDAADTFNTLSIDTIDTLDGKRGTKATYLGQTVAGIPNGLGRKKLRDGVVINGYFIGGGTNDGFSILENLPKGELYISFNVSGVSTMNVSVKQSQLAGPSGCQGDYQDWIIVTGRCTLRGLQPDPSKGLLLLNRYSFDAYRINGQDSAEYMMLRLGVMIRGKTRKPLEFVKGEVIVPWMTSSGITERVEYTGPMEGLSMHGQGQCRSTDTTMVPCTMNYGRRAQ
jgi:hypothetical protein